MPPSFSMCPWSDCWCRDVSWRYVMSTGLFFSYREIPPTWWQRLRQRLGARPVRRFEQVYREAA